MKNQQTRKKDIQSGNELKLPVINSQKSITTQKLFNNETPTSNINSSKSLPKHLNLSNLRSFSSNKNLLLTSSQSVSKLTITKFNYMKQSQKIVQRQIQNEKSILISPQKRSLIRISAQKTEQINKNYSSIQKLMNDSPLKRKLKGITQIDHIDQPAIISLSKSSSLYLQSLNSFSGLSKIQNNQASYIQKNIPPRVFPSESVPLKIVVSRKIKEFQTFNLNKLIQHINWKFNYFGATTPIHTTWGNENSAFQLIYYDHQQDYIIQYIGINHSNNINAPQNSSRQNKLIEPISSLAYNKNKNMYLPFLISQYIYNQTNQFYYFKGKFTTLLNKKQQDQLCQQFQIIHRLYIYFICQSPLLYLNRILKAIDQRQKVMKTIQFMFYAENIQINSYDQLSHKIIDAIQTKIKQGMRCFYKPQLINDKQALINDKQVLDSVQLSNIQRQTSEQNKCQVLTYYARKQINQSYSKTNNRLVFQELIQIQVQSQPIQSPLLQSQQQKQFSLSIKSILPFISIPQHLQKKPKSLDQNRTLVIRKNFDKDEGKQGKYKLIKLHKRTIKTKVEELKIRFLYEEPYVVRTITQVRRLISRINHGDIRSLNQHTQSRTYLFNLDYLLNRQPTAKYQQKSLMQSQISSTSSLTSPSNPSQSISLQKLLSSYIINQFQQTLLLINQVVIQPILSVFKQLIQNYLKMKNNHVKVKINNLWTQSQIDQTDFYERIGEEYSTVTQFYQKKLQKIVRITDQIIKQQVRTFINKQIHRLRYQMILKRKIPLIHTQLIINLPFPSNFNQNYSIKDFITLPIIFNQSKFIQTFIGISKGLTNRLNISLQSIRKTLFFQHNIYYLPSEDILDDGSKFLRVITLKDQQINMFITGSIYKIFRQTNYIKIEQQNKQNYDKFYQLGFITQFIQSTFKPLLKQITTINRQMQRVVIFKPKINEVHTYQHNQHDQQIYKNLFSQEFISMVKDIVLQYVGQRSNFQVKISNQLSQQDILCADIKIWQDHLKTLENIFNDPTDFYKYLHNSYDNQMVMLSISSRVIYQTFRQKINAQINHKKQLLIKKLSFQVMYAQSQLSTIKSCLQSIPTTVSQLIQKIDYLKTQIHIQLKQQSPNKSTILQLSKRLYKLCQSQSCYLSRSLMGKYFQNIKILAQIYRQITIKQQQCLSKKEMAHDQIRNQHQQLDQIKNNFIYGVQFIKNQTQKAVTYRLQQLNHQENNKKSQNQQSHNPSQQNDKKSQQHKNSYNLISPTLKQVYHNQICLDLHTQYLQIQFLANDIYHKQSSLQMYPITSKQYLLSFQISYINYFNIWQSISSWTKVKYNWLYGTLQDIKLDKPQIFLANIVRKLKQTTQYFRSSFNHQDKSTIQQNKSTIGQNKSTIGQKKSTIQQNKLTIQQNKLTIQQHNTIQIIQHKNYIKQHQNSIKQHQNNTKIKHFIQLLIEQINLFNEKPLTLLKILKKQGFTKKHLQKVGFNIQGSFQSYTLDQAIKQNFLNYLTQIEAVSNDAWLSFHLQTSLDRILLNLKKLTFEFVSKNDKSDNKVLVSDIKGNQTFYISNYKQLCVAVEETLLNLQTIFQNPSKSQYQIQLKKLYKQTLYISKCLQVLQQFQQKYISIYPIFQSIEVIKQLSQENRNFVKITRGFMQIMLYCKRMSAVMDACNGQNIYQKIFALLKKLQSIRILINNYLQTKRKTFNRYYFLADTEMFQLFSKASDITKLQTMLSNMWPDIDGLVFQQNQLNQCKIISGIKFAGMKVTLKLNKIINIQNKNMDLWFSELDKRLKQTVLSRISSLVLNQKVDYKTVINQECCQAVILVQQINNYKSFFKLQNNQQLLALQKASRTKFNQLIQLKKSYSNGLNSKINELNSKISNISPIGNGLSYNSEQTLNSLIILVFFLLQQIKQLKLLNFSLRQTKESYPFKKLLKFLPKFINATQLLQIQISSFQSTYSYGNDFIGIYKKLVITELTDRMTILYINCFRDGLGGCAVGPAGTGKSETTKDIANILGKNCIIYNCSKHFQKSSALRIFKGMITNGIWITFDQFNLLSYTTMAILIQHIHTLFKYRNYGSKINIDFEKQNLLLVPSFHFCITYNPTYKGRTQIPSSLKNNFRTIALMKIDLKMISTIKLYTKGFKKAEQLAINLTNVFRKAQIEWPNQQYDFGLRNFISVINKAQINFNNNKQSFTPQHIIVNSILSIILPQMQKIDKQIFENIIKVQYSNYYKNKQNSTITNQNQINKINKQLISKKNIISKNNINEKKTEVKTQTNSNKFNQDYNNLEQIIKVRNGIIIYGKSLSGKQYLMKQYFLLNSSNVQYQTVYVNPLTVKEIYGEMNHALNVWNDGVFTKALKSLISRITNHTNHQINKDHLIHQINKNHSNHQINKNNSNQQINKNNPNDQNNKKNINNFNKKGILLVNGLVHHEWMQNLNTVLDFSRILNLASAQVISIPSNLYLIFNSNSVKCITPASLSRNGIMYLQQMNQQNIIQNTFPNQLSQQQIQQIKKVIIFYHQQIQQIIQNHLKYKVNKIFVFYWLVKVLHLFYKQVNKHLLVFAIATYYQGLFTHQGRLRFQNLVLQQLNINHVFQKRLILKTNLQQKQDIPNQVQSLSQYQWQNYRQLNSIQPKFYSSKQIQQINQQNIDLQSGKIFIITLSSQKIRQFYENSLNNKLSQCLVIMGQNNIGKSTILQCLTDDIVKNPIYQSKILYLNKSLSLHKIYNKLCEMMYRKNNKKIGSLPGKHLLIQIQNLQLAYKSQSRKQYHNTYELMRLIVSQKAWYNYQKLEFQHIEDVMWTADFKLNNQYINIDQRLLRHLQPIFINSINQQTYQHIFKTIVSSYFKETYNTQNGYRKYQPKSLLNVLKNIQQQAISSLLNFSQEINDSFEKKFHSNSHIRKIYKINLNDLMKIVKSMFLWQFNNTISQINNKNIKQQNVNSLYNYYKQILVYQTLRISESKIGDSSSLAEFNQILSKHFPQITELQQLNNPLIYIPQFIKTKQLSKLPLISHKILQIDDFVRLIQCVVDQYNAENNQQTYVQKTQIIIFKEMCVTLAKLIRTFILKKSHVLFISFPTSGKSVLLKLTAFILKGKYVTSQINYQRSSWLQQFQIASKSCFQSKRHTILSISNEYLLFPQVSEDISQFLNTYYLKQAYSQADFQELVYILQSFLLKNSLQVNKQNCKHFFFQYLKDHFHLALNLHPNNQHTLRILNDYPALLKQTIVFSLIQWPKQALILATKRSVQNQFLEIQNLPDIFVQIHNFCKEIAMQTKSNVWNGMYFDFIQTFKQQVQYSLRVLNLQKQNFEKGLQIVTNTNQQIQKIKNEIKKIQPTIMQLQKQTQRTLKTIKIQKTTFQHSNQILKEKTIQCKQILQKSQKIQKQYEKTNLQVAQKLDIVWKNVSLIKQTHISQIKSLNNPSQFIKIVLTALVIIFHNGPIIKQKDQNGLHFEQNYFQTAKRYVLTLQAQTITGMLVNFNRDSITKQTVKKIQIKCMSHKKWNDKQAKSVNKAIYYFYLWVDAIVKHFHMFQDTQPVRKQLRQVNYLIESKNKQLYQTKTQQKQLQLRIQQLTNLVDEKQHKLAGYSGEVNHYQKIIQRGQLILNEIQMEKLKWLDYVKDIDQQLYNLNGNCIQRSVLIVYAAIHSYQLRQKIRIKVQSLLNQSNIPHNKKIWLFKPMKHQQTFKILQISDNDYIKNNLIIIQSSRKPIVLIDPEQQGVRYIKELNKYSNRLILLKIDEQSQQFEKKLQQTIQTGRLMLIQFAGKRKTNQIQKQDNKNKKNSNNNNKNLIKDILKLQYKKNLPQTLQEYINLSKRFNFYIKSKQKKPYSQLQNQNTPVSFKIHELSQIYFFTKDSSISSIQMSTKCQLINFNMTQMQLQHRIKKLLVSAEFPDVQLQIDQTIKFGTKSKITMKQIQIKMLNTFTIKSASQLINHQQTLDILTASNRLYVQLNIKLTQSQQKRKQLKKQEKNFQSRAQKYAKIYFNLKKITLLHQSSVYSFIWFERSIQKHPNNFLQVIAFQVSSGVQKKHQVIVQFLIAQAYHNQLNWNLLFQKCIQNESIHYQTQIKKLSQKLIITNQYASRIYNNIKRLSGYLASIKQHLASIKQPLVSVKQIVKQDIDVRCQIFKDLINAKTSELLQKLPDQYSQLQFFNKILLISCFKQQDQTLHLLRQWLKSNFSQFYSKKPKLQLTYHFKKQPIIIIFEQNLIEQLKIKRIENIYQKFSKFNKTILYINMVKEDTNRLNLLLNNAIQNDQWLVIQGITAHIQKITWFLIQFYQNNVDINKIDEFKVFIQVDTKQVNIIPNYFLKTCMKLMIHNDQSISDIISDSFLLLGCQKQLNKLQQKQRNQRKYLISQLCIFHHFLQQKTHYKSTLFNDKSISFQFHQLQSFVNFIIKQKNNIDQIKPLIIRIGMEMIYGIKMSDQEDKNNLLKHFQQFINITKVQRSVFWQTIWADEKFPKNKAEYKQYLKQLITSIHNQKLQSSQKQKLQSSHNQSLQKQLLHKQSSHKQICLDYFQLFYIDENFKIQQSFQIFDKLRLIQLAKNEDSFKLQDDQNLIFKAKLKIKQLLSQLIQLKPSITNLQQQVSYLVLQKTINHKQIQKTINHKQIQKTINHKQIQPLLRYLKYETHKYHSNYQFYLQTLEYYYEMDPQQDSQIAFYSEFLHDKIGIIWNSSSKLTITQFFKEFIHSMNQFSSYIHQVNQHIKSQQKQSCDKKLSFSLKSIRMFSTFMSTINQIASFQQNQGQIILIPKSILQKINNIQNKNIKITQILTVKDFFLWNCSVSADHQLFTVNYQKNQAFYTKNIQFQLITLHNCQNIDRKLLKRQVSLKQRLKKLIISILSPQKDIKQSNFSKLGQKTIKLSCKKVALCEHRLDYLLQISNYNYIYIPIISSVPSISQQNISFEADRKRVHLFIRQ